MLLNTIALNAQSCETVFGGGRFSAPAAEFLLKALSTMTPAFFGRDGRSLSTRVATLTAMAGANAGENTTLIRVAGVAEPSPFGGKTIAARLRIVETAISPGETSVVVDDLLTTELLAGRSVVLDMPGNALVEPGLSGRLDIMRVVPIGPCKIDFQLTSLSMRDHSAVRTGDSSEPVRYLSCGLAPGISSDEGGRLGNAGRASDRVGDRWLDIGIPDLPPREWDAVMRGTPSAGVVALGQTLLREVRGLPPTVSQDKSSGEVEIMTARLWALAMDVQALERGYLPDPDDLARAPIIHDWGHVLRPASALTGRFEGHPYIRDGARSVTSEVFHTDGRTYARTLSRLYRLGPPAGRRLQ